jgi:hypothetical protein
LKTVNSAMKLVSEASSPIDDSKLLTGRRQRRHKIFPLGKECQSQGVWIEHVCAMVRTLIFRSPPCVAKKSISSDLHTFGIDTISGHRCKAIVTKVDVGKDTNTSNYVKLDPHEKVQDPSFKKGDVGAVCTLHPKVQNLVQFIFSKTNMPTTLALTLDSENRLLGKPSQVALSSGGLCHSHLSGSTTTPVQESPDIDCQVLALGLCETTPLNHDSQEFKSLQTYFHQSQPGVPEADDPSRSEYGSPVVEDIFQISRTVELGALAPVEQSCARGDPTGAREAGA